MIRKALPGTSIPPCPGNDCLAEAGSGRRFRLPRVFMKGPRGPAKNRGGTSGLRTGTIW